MGGPDKDTLYDVIYGQRVKDRSKGKWLSYKSYSQEEI